MDIQRTRAYYAGLTDADICGCEYCQNYVRQIRKSHPLLARKLDDIGVDIEKPFEVISVPLDEAGCNVLYAEVQYIVMGSQDDFEAFTIEGTEVKITTDHPSTDGIF